MAQMNQPIYDLKDMGELAGIAAEITRDLAMSHQIMSSYIAPIEQFIMFNDQAAANNITAPRTKHSLAVVRALLENIAANLVFLDDLSNQAAQEAEERSNGKSDENNSISV